MEVSHEEAHDHYFNHKDLKIGDEVSVYYDGVFITKLTVEK